LGAVDIYIISLKEKKGRGPKENICQEVFKNKNVSHAHPIVKYKVTI
jgi:hypothetical protein